MSRRTLSLQQRQLAEQRRLLRRIVDVPHVLPAPQHQQARPERSIDQQQHVSNQ
jgi:hypothetical protein